MQALILAGGAGTRLHSALSCLGVWFRCQGPARLMASPYAIRGFTTSHQCNDLGVV